MKCSNIISDFTWSYSRIQSFFSCRYQFFLRYILGLREQPLFFSDYGGFIHQIMEQYLRGELAEQDLSLHYLSHFREAVVGQAPNQKIFQRFFEDGLRYLSHPQFPYPAPLAVESRFSFSVERLPFVGIVDCLAEDNGQLILLDHKSRSLKPRSGRATPTKTDQELDDYLRQLYLYAIPVREQYGRFPDRLAFNCFRTGTLIQEPFQPERVEAVKAWAKEAVDTITENEDWSPDLDFWKCRYLCGLHHQCEYFQANNGRNSS